MARDVYAYKCQKCGELHYPYRMRCKGCGDNDWEEFDPVPLPKEGKLLTFTRVYNLPGDFEVATLGLGIVELVNGMRMTAQIEIEEPRIGMDVVGSVEVVRRDLYDAYHGMVFREA
jgi:uncharacterized OB-fold protein